MISAAFEQALSDVSDLLQMARMDFAVIDGLCVLVRGEPRFTQDIDLVIATEPQEAVPLLGLLDQFGFQPLLEDEAEDFMRQAYMLPLHHRTTGLTVDIAIGSMGFERQLIERSESIALGRVSVPMATAEDLILMKLVAGRPRDMDDVAGVVETHPDLDWDYLFETGAGLQRALSQDLIPQIERLQSRS